MVVGAAGAARAPSPSVPFVSASSSAFDKRPRRRRIAVSTPINLDVMSFAVQPTQRARSGGFCTRLELHGRRLGLCLRCRRRRRLSLVLSPLLTIPLPLFPPPLFSARGLLRGRRWERPCCSRLGP
uniref:Uncharacterized protein n=1 Tax=Trieres chinensis TaxID=1514140 RepID=A0A7S1ZZ37_TRICV